MSPQLVARETAPPARHANTGGPMSRTRTEHVRASLLGQEDGLIRCPRVIRLGLAFGHRHPLPTLRRLLREAGLHTPEDLRQTCEVPAGRLLCRPLPAEAPRLPVADADRGEVLRQALLLGLCTALLFDPERPVLWTEASLTRALELFDPAGFYA